MLNAARVRPMEGLFALPPRRDLKPDHHNILPLNRGSIFCLCDAPPQKDPRILRAYRLTDLRVGKTALSATLVDDEGRWYERVWAPGDRYEPLDLYKGLFLFKPSYPVRARKNPPYGLRAVFEASIPWQYKVHHLSYLQRVFPNVVRKLRAA